jgi:hypothetical protein
VEKKERRRIGQLSLALQGSFEKYGKQTRRQKFLEEMDQIMPWAALESLIEPHYPKESNGPPPVGRSIKLRIYSALDSGFASYMELQTVLVRHEHSNGPGALYL